MFDSVRRPAQELLNGGDFVSIFAVKDDRSEVDLPLWSPLLPQTCVRRGPSFFGYAPCLVSSCKAARPEMIAIHGLWKYTSIAVQKVSSALACPYVVHPEGMLDPWALRNSPWKKRLAAWAYEGRHLANAACLRALNASEAAAIRQYGLRNPICLIPNAIDLPSKIVESLPLIAANPTDRRAVLFLGRIHPKKGLPILIDGWDRLRKCHGRAAAAWTLAIAGWDQGGHQAELQRKVADLGLGDTVSFLGPQFGDDKAACYRHCDAFVLPSYSEGLPMAILEAWAYAKPVLMTPECNLPDGFAAGAAIRIETSPASVATGLSTLLEMSDAQRHSMGQRGFDLVKQRYTWPEVARQMHEVYTWVSGGGTPPACVEGNGK
jgi:glycosyltransferase involved in cell wall biosynthesis